MKKCSIMIHPRRGRASMFLVTSTFCNAVTGVIYIYIYIYIYILYLLRQKKLVFYYIFVQLILDPCDIGGKNPCGAEGFCEVKTNGAYECIGILLVKMFNFCTCHVCVVLSAEYGCIRHSFSFTLLFIP